MNIDGKNGTVVFLFAAGMIAYSFVVPLSLVIAGLLAIFTLSYEQTIHAYPNGSGSYISKLFFTCSVPWNCKGLCDLTRWEEL